MNNKLKHISAAAAFCCAAAMTSALPANAVDNQPPADEPHFVKIESVCPDFVPQSEDEIQFYGLYYNTAHIKIVQHSPERENLVLYDTDLQCGPDYIYTFAAEPGDYTISISTGRIFNSPCLDTYTQDFKIDNADYSKDPQYSKTTVSFCGKYLRADDDNKGEMPELLYSETYYQIGKKEPVNVIGFPRYKRSRGDFNGDGQVDSADAQLTLNTYADILASIPKEVLSAAWCAADINGDETIDSADAQNILIFYTDTLTGNTPHWPDGSTDGAHDEQYIDHTAVIPSRSYELEIRAVPYFMNERPENADERGSQIDRAKTHFTKPITIDVEFVGDSGEFLDANGAKKINLSFSALGEAKSVMIRNSVVEFPGFIKYGEMMQFTMKDPAAGNETFCKMECETCSGTAKPYLHYCKGCYVEYNVNTMQIQVYPFTEFGSPLKVMPYLLDDY